MNRDLWEEVSSTGVDMAQDDNVCDVKYYMANTDVQSNSAVMFYDTLVFANEARTEPFLYFVCIF